MTKMIKISAILTVITICLFFLSRHCAFAVPIPAVTQQTEKKTEDVKSQKPFSIKKEPSRKPVDIVSEKKDSSEKPHITQDKLDAFQEIRDQAKLLYNSSKSDEASKLYSTIPDSEKISEDWLIMANIAQDKDKIIDAVFYLKKAIQADEKNYKAHYNLGNLYFSDNKINMALSEYRKVLRIKKDYAYAYYNKGCCYLKKKSWFNAKYEFGLAIKANPEEPSFYYNLAYTYKMLKKPKKAQEALDMYNKLMAQ